MATEKTEHKHKIGDVVKLASGGPSMTVHALKTGDGLACKWFDKDEALQSGEFNAAALIPASPKREDSSTPA